MLEPAVKGGKGNAAVDARCTLKPWMRKAARILLVCLASLGLATAAARPAKGQDYQAQMVVTQLSIKCADKTYKIALASVPAKLKAGAVNAVGIILSAPQAADSKLFFVYWLDPAQPKPTKRDDDRGWDGKPLHNYTKEVIGNFIKNAQCTDDPQLVQEISDLIDSASRNPQAAELANRLKQKIASVGEVTPSQERMAPAEFPDELSFSKAAHDFVLKNLPSEDCPAQLAAAQKEAQDWKKKAEDSEARVRKLEEQQSAQSSSPWLDWVLIVLAVIFLAVVIAQTLSYRKEKQLLHEQLEQERTKASAEGGELSAAEASLSRIYNEAERLKPELDRATSITTQVSGKLNKINKSYKDLLIKARQYLESQVLNDEIKRILTAASEKKKKSAQPAGLAEDVQTTASVNEAAQAKKTAEGTGDVSKTELVLSQAEEDQINAETGEQEQDAQGVAGPVLQYALELDRQLSVITLTPRPGPLFPRLTKLENGISEMWSLCADPGEPHTEASLDKLLRSAKNALSLANELSRQFNIEDRNARTVRTRVEKLFSELKRIDKELLVDIGSDGNTPEDILKKVEEKIGNLKTKEDEYDTLQPQLTEMEKEVEPLMQPEEKGRPIQAARRIVKDYGEASNRLPATNGDNPSARFIPLSARIVAQQEEINLTVEDINQALKTTGNDINQALKTTASSIGKRVAKLIEKFHVAQAQAGEAAGLRTKRDQLQEALDLAKPEARLGKALARQIADYLQFDTEKVRAEKQPVKQVIDNLKNEPLRHRRLRLRFLAAISAFDEAIKNGYPRLQVLRIEKIKKNMEEFLPRLEDLSGEALWEDGLRQGFNHQWLHDLLRADLLLRHYLNAQDGSVSTMMLDPLSDAVYQASEAVITTLCEYNVEVNKINLFEMPRDVKTKLDAAEDLLNTPAAVAKVKEHLRSSSSGFVVDVLAFPVKRQEDEIAKGYVTIANMGDWLGRKSQ